LECSVVQEQYTNENLRELFEYVIAIQILSRRYAKFSQKKGESMVSVRNQTISKTIFKIITKEKTELNVISARWNYLESGHNKGACDGLGTSVKRSAEMDIRQK